MVTEMTLSEPRWGVDPHFDWNHLGRLDDTVSFPNKTSSAVHTSRVQGLRNQQVSGSNPLVGSRLS